MAFSQKAKGGKFIQFHLLGAAWPICETPMLLGHILLLLRIRCVHRSNYPPISTFDGSNDAVWPEEVLAENRTVNKLYSDHFPIQLNTQRPFLWRIATNRNLSHSRTVWDIACICNFLEVNRKFCCEFLCMIALLAAWRHSTPEVVQPFDRTFPGFFYFIFIIAYHFTCIDRLTPM